MGAMVRRARKHGERTLQQVAADTGLSISYLSQIERDILTPSVSTLRRIADALDIPAGSLVFARESSRPAKLVAVLRRAERKSISFPQSNIDYELLTPDLRRRASMLWIVAKPGAESGPPLTHVGEDMVVVLKGRLGVEVGGVWHELRLGDSIFFNSELPHRWSNPGRSPAEAIWVSSPPSF